MILNTFEITYTHGYIHNTRQTHRTYVLSCTWMFIYNFDSIKTQGCSMGQYAMLQGLCWFS